MDEPFGAVDPIVRAGLQAELLGILRRLAKTVIFVTHDIDEAIRMGDLFAIMKDGRLVQCASPEALLAAPKDAFVADFVGADRALKRLTLTTAGEAATPTSAPAGPGAPVVSPATSLRDVLSLLLRLRRRRCHGRRCRRHADRAPSRWRRSASVRRLASPEPRQATAGKQLIAYDPSRRRQRHTSLVVSSMSRATYLPPA